MADEEKPEGEEEGEAPPPEPEEEVDLPDCKKLQPLEQVLKAEARKIPYKPTPIDCSQLDKEEDEEGEGEGEGGEGGEEVETKSKKKVNEPPPPPPTSRDFRLYKAMNTKEWGESCECHGTKDQAALDLLAVTITTVMLLAVGAGDIKQPQLKWAASCLDNVRDDNGQVPPNTRYILNIINSKITPDEEPAKEEAAPAE